MEKAISTFCDWLAATQLSLLFQTVTWIIPMVQSVHIMAITVVMGSVLMIDMKLLGVVGRGTPVTAMTRRFLPWVWVSLIVLLATGTILTIAEPARELINNTFRLKMVLVAVVSIITVLFQETVRRHAEAWGDTPYNKGLARTLAIVTLAIWVGIMMCGRWIAYVEHG